MEKHITTPITQKITKALKSGDYVYKTGEKLLTWSGLQVI